MVFYFAFWLIVATIFVLLLAGGAHKKLGKKADKFIENTFKDEEENEKNE